MSPSTEPFRVPHVVLARLAVEEYVGAFWWVFAPIPVFGLWALMAGGSTQVQALGVFACLWPITLPARAYFATRKAGALFAAGVRMRIQGDSLYVVPVVEGTGLRLALDSIRGVKARHGYQLVRMRRPGFLPVPDNAFPAPAAREEFLAALRGQRADSMARTA